MSSVRPVHSGPGTALTQAAGSGSMSSVPVVNTLPISCWPFSMAVAIAICSPNSPFVSYRFQLRLRHCLPGQSSLSLRVLLKERIANQHKPAHRERLCIAAEQSATAAKLAVVHVAELTAEGSSHRLALASAGSTRDCASARAKELEHRNQITKEAAERERIQAVRVRPTAVQHAQQNTFPACFLSSN